MKLITLEEAVQLASDADPKDLLTLAQYQDLNDDTNYQAERDAENAWLRVAESAGWEEAYLDDLRESGLRV